MRVILKINRSLLICPNVKIKTKINWPIKLIIVNSSVSGKPFTQQANLTGQPAISLPTHIAQNGLPLGIQFTARKGNEASLLQLGQLFETHHQFKMLYPTTVAN